MTRFSMTRRLALLFAALMSLGLLSLGLYLSTAIQNHFVALDRDTLLSALSRIQSALPRQPPGTDTAQLHDRLDTLLFGHERLMFWILQPNGEVLLSDVETSLQPAPLPAVLVQATSNAKATVDWDHGGHSFRGVALTLPQSGSWQAGLRLVAALNIDHHRHFMEHFRQALWLAVVAALLVAVVLGYLISRGGLKPLSEMTAQVRRVVPDKLGQQLPIDSLPLELVDLAEAFNSMLERLDQSFQRLTHFTSDIAHELRTPVTSMLTQTQVGLSHQRSAAEYREILASNAEELERLSRMIADMLYLAKADNQLLIPQPEHFDLRQDVQGLLDMYEALAEEQGLSLRLNGAADLCGDRLMVRRAVNNLLSNAVRHALPGSVIDIDLQQHESLVRIDVRNQGNPIAPDLLPSLTDRFVRGDSHRLREGGGTGLGLAIVKSIMLAHAGRLQIRSDHDTTCFSLEFPNPQNTAMSKVQPSPSK